MFQDVLHTMIDSTGLGYIYIREDLSIGMINETAGRMIGLITDETRYHSAGKIERGDIVILADNDFGADDGNLTTTDLEKIGIFDRSIEPGGMLLAVGAYGVDGTKATYKYLQDYVGADDGTVQMTQNHQGIPIKVSVDYFNNLLAIQVEQEIFELKYAEAMGHCVILDGKTKQVKFFQSMGYTLRKESLGELLRGASWAAKSSDCALDVLEMFPDTNAGVVFFSDFLWKLQDLMEKEDKTTDEGILDVFKYTLHCKLLRIRRGENMDGVHVFLQNAETLKKSIQIFDEIRRTIETRRKDKMVALGLFPQRIASDLIGDTPMMLEVKKMVYRVSQNTFNVFITGESGTGKSVLARMIHDSGDKETPFVEVNCNAIAPSLLESELFGYVGGAFTGANPKGKKGYFEHADGGTIFLDEIGELTPELQVKLLHVIQNRHVYPVGSRTPIHVNVRIITATNKDLEREVKEHRFRQDLYYRINVIRIHMPSLRQRKGDLEALTYYILQKTCRKNGLRERALSKEAMEVISDYDWPGNVRELENVIERALTVCDGPMIYKEHLMLPSSVSLSAAASGTLKAQLEIEEARIIREALVRNGDDKQKTIRELGISQAAFYKKLKKFTEG